MPGPVTSAALAGGAASRFHACTPPRPVACAGGIKRWGFARGNMTHGSKSKREHGSTGPGSTPGRVFPGLKAAGQMGNVRTKLRKVEVRARGGDGAGWVCTGGGQLHACTPASMPLLAPARLFEQQPGKALLPAVWARCLSRCTALCSRVQHALA